MHIEPTQLLGARAYGGLSVNALVLAIGRWAAESMVIGMIVRHIQALRSTLHS